MMTVAVEARQTSYSGSLYSGGACTKSSRGVRSRNCREGPKGCRDGEKGARGHQARFGKR
eukprot:5943275-Pyramimonas_sp.AAC.1